MIMNIRCEVCANLDHCRSDISPDTCGRFEIGIDKLIETADKLSREYGIRYENALKAIDICLKYGGYTVD